MHAERRARIAVTLIALAATLLLAGCTQDGYFRLGRKGSLEVPNAATPTTNVLRAPTAQEADVVVTEGDRIPTLDDPLAPEAQFRAADVRDDNADAPEPGDAIPEGPISDERAPRRRFLLDFLL